MRKLILVRHSLPQKEPGVAAKLWHLSDEGKARCKPLAEKLAAYSPVAIVSSEEPKAVETAQLVAQSLGNLPCETAPNLHEHDRTNVGYLSDEAFQQTVARFFARPDQLVMGLETARQAHDRFKKAVQNVLDKYPQGNLIIVAHGTVISLFVAALKQIDPYPFWQQLELPDIVELTLNED